MDRIQMYLTATELITEFSETVVGLQGQKKSAIWEMGFGAIQNMGRPKLCEQVCTMMLHNIDPLNQTVEIHGCTLSIAVSDFARVMGINDGGVDIEFRGEMDHSLMKYVRSNLVESNAVDVTRSSLKNVVLHREVVDSIFRVSFVMYSLSAVLCPSKEIEVDEMLILHLMQTRSVKDLNWATYCFNKMMDSVLTLKLMGQGGKYVCMLFLQLYYFDAVGNSLGWVDKGTTPIMFWANDNVGHLMGWMARQVGSPTMPKWLQSQPINCGPSNCLDNSGSSQRKYDRAEEQLKIAISEIALVKTQMRELYSRVSRMEPLIEHLSNVAEKVCQEMSDLNGGGIKSMVGEMLEHIKPITNENPNFVAPEMGPTEVKSNSTHFNGGNKENVAAQSSDYSLRFLYTNPPKKQDGKCVQENPGKVGKEKHPIVDVSECSVSPGDPPKNSRKRRKEKQRRSPVLAPKTIVRALFETQSAYKGANLRPAIPSADSQRMRAQKIYAGPFLLHGKQKQDDIDLLDFLFMERTTDDTYSRAIVASHEGMEVSRKEIQCLGPGNLVCNLVRHNIKLQVINTFAAYLNETGSGCWFLPTFFQIYSRGKGPDISTQEWIAHTKTICRLHRFAKQIETCVRVFIPLHEEAQSAVEIGHWYLLVVHIRARYAEILDSCPTESKKVSRMQAARQAMSMLDVVFGDDIVAGGSLSINIGSLPFKISGNAPRQPNAQDCGVFVIKNMQSYGLDWAAKYDSNRQRASLVLDCVRHPRNEVAGLNEMVQEALGLWRKTKVAI